MNNFETTCIQYIWNLKIETIKLLENFAGGRLNNLPKFSQIEIKSHKHTATGDEHIIVNLFFAQAITLNVD